MVPTLRNKYDLLFAVPMNRLVLATYSSSKAATIQPVAMVPVPSSKPGLATIWTGLAIGTAEEDVVEKMTLDDTTELGVCLCWMIQQS